MFGFKFTLASKFCNTTVEFPYVAILPPCVSSSREAYVPQVFHLCQVYNLPAVL